VVNCNFHRRARVNDLWRPTFFKGSLCSRWTAQSYLLPVFDTTLVRQCWRGRGFGLQMLSDFCSLFPREEVVGVSSPLAPSMVAGQFDGGGGGGGGQIVPTW